MSIDEAFAKAQLILAEAQSALPAIISEEDAKTQIILRLLTEALGWSHSEIAAEEPNENGYSDYKVGRNSDLAFVLEAKRIGVIDINTSSQRQSSYKLSGPVLRPARAGILQVASYSQSHGAPLAILSDGVNWVIFLPWVPKSNFMDKQGIVFPGFASILEDFSKFYELLSKHESRRNTFQLIFDRIHENRLVLDQPLEPPFSVSDNYLISKTALAFDLEAVFDSFFSQLIGDNDPDMLVECFVESRESILADFALERIARNVLGNINPSEVTVEEGLKDLVQNAVAGESGQTIFVVGPAGAGKSTFLDRFFARTLPAYIRDKCIPVHVNCLDASPDTQIILNWIIEQIIDGIHSQIYEDGAPTRDQLLGLFHLEYKIRAKSTDARLYERDKEAFKDKFDLYMERNVQEDRDGYLKRLLKDIVINRKRLPVIIIDNTDEFDLGWKIAVFQYLQSIRRAAVHCLVVFPATDKSAWIFSKTDIFNIYASRSFFLPSPSPREVFRKRIDYVKRRLDQKTEPRRAAEYFGGRGIRIKLPDIAAFASTVENVFVDQDYTARRVGEIANYNMRSTLRLSKRIMTSSVIKIEDLVRSFITGSILTPSSERFYGALMKGDYAFFRPGDERLIFPVFQVDETIRQTPLIHLRILDLLRGLHNHAYEDLQRYIAVESLISYFGHMAISEIAVQRSVEALLDANLIEPYDMSKREFSYEQRVAIAYSGLSHLDLATSNPIYFEQMALTTRVTDANVAEQIRFIGLKESLKEAESAKIREIFAEYLVEEDGSHCNVPDRDEYRAQRDLGASLLNHWRDKKIPVSEMLYLPELAAERVPAIVQWFDKFKGFGFVDVPSFRDNAFVHAKVVQQSNLGDLHDGDQIICDISRNDKGLFVSQLHGRRNPSKIQAIKCQVVKLVPERGYGFVSVEDSGMDAFFHFNLFSPADKPRLIKGLKLVAEIQVDNEGKSQLRRVLEILAT